MASDRVNNKREAAWALTPWRDRLSMWFMKKLAQLAFIVMFVLLVKAQVGK